MKNFLALNPFWSSLLTALSFSSTALIAQEAATGDQDDESSTPKPDKAASVTEHIVKQNAIAASSSQRTDAALKLRRERAMSLHAMKVDYLEKVASGKVNPLQSFKDAAPKMQIALPILEVDYKSFLAATDPAEKEKLQSIILKAIEPYGTFLNNAQARKTDLQLSPDQLLEIKRISQLQQTVALADDNKLRGLSFSPLAAPFTLLDLPIPLTLYAPPHTKIYLPSNTGGEFANGLAYIELDTGEKGVATTSWVSHGDSVAANTIYAVSSSGSSAHSIEVKDLSINFPIEPQDLIPAIK